MKNIEMKHQNKIIESTNPILVHPILRLSEYLDFFTEKKKNINCSKVCGS